MITGKSKLEEKCESAQKNILKSAALRVTMILNNDILNNKITLTMQNSDITQETTAQLRAGKSNLRQNYSKKLKRKKLVLTHNLLEIDKTESKEATSVDHWENQT